MTRLEIAVRLIASVPIHERDMVLRAFDLAEEILAEEERRAEVEKELMEKTYVKHMRPDGSYRYGPPLKPGDGQ